MCLHASSPSDQKMFDDKIHIGRHHAKIIKLPTVRFAKNEFCVDPIFFTQHIKIIKSLPNIPLTDITPDVTAIAVLKLPYECELSWGSVEVLNIDISFNSVSNKDGWCIIKIFDFA